MVKDQVLSAASVLCAWSAAPPDPPLTVAVYFVPDAKLGDGLSVAVRLPASY